MTTVVCPQCRGRRVVFDPMALFTGIALPIVLLVEADSDHGVSKKTCPTCNGGGYLRLPPSENV